LPIEVYIARHATPDWTRTDIRYDVAPGPPLTPQGEAESYELGTFLVERRISRLYTSPLVRACRTAELAAEVLMVSHVVDQAIAEWSDDDTSETVASRLMPFWRRVCLESEREGPVCLVTHGGPLGLLLHTLGLPKEILASYRGRFDRNPAPPAGVWSAVQSATGSPWELELVFAPKGAK
jgi:broad specificity phosphatase PhoE